MSDHRANTQFLAAVLRLSDILDFDFRETVSYQLIKFLRTNQDTMINQKPLVSVGDKVKKVLLMAIPKIGKKDDEERES